MRERKDKIKTFLSKFFRNHELRDDDDIFAMGFVNSLLALQLVNFLQKEDTSRILASPKFIYRIEAEPASSVTT